MSLSDAKARAILSSRSRRRTPISSDEHDFHWKIAKEGDRL